jgi:hypothetical protein
VGTAVSTFDETGTDSDRPRCEHRLWMIYGVIVSADRHFITVEKMCLNCGVSALVNY